MGSRFIDSPECLHLACLLVVKCGLDQTREQRMRLGRAGLELRMGLSGHEERMHLTRQFHEFGELTVGALA